MTEYYTARKQGKIFVHSIWSGSWFIAVKFDNNSKVMPFSPYMDRRFRSYEDAEKVLLEYANAHHLEEVTL